MRLVFSTLLLAFAALLQGCAPVVVGTAVGTTAVVATDRRTTGIFVEDQNIELKAQSRINERFRDQVNVSATSFNRLVLLTGEAPNESLKTEIASVARSVESVRDVVNEIQIAAPSSYGARSNDAYLTSKVKARLLDAKTVTANHIKVVTESGTVYLMGLVKQEEGKEAADIASTTGGVRKVVKVFEYTN